MRCTLSPAAAGGAGGAASLEVTASDAPSVFTNMAESPPRVPLNGMPIAAFEDACNVAINGCRVFDQSGAGFYEILNPVGNIPHDIEAVGIEPRSGGGVTRVLRLGEPLPDSARVIKAAVWDNVVIRQRGPHEGHVGKIYKFTPGTSGNGSDDLFTVRSFVEGKVDSHLLTRPNLGWDAERWPQNWNAAKREDLVWQHAGPAAGENRPEYEWPKLEERNIGHPLSARAAAAGAPVRPALELHADDFERYTDYVSTEDVSKLVMMPQCSLGSRGNVSYCELLEEREFGIAARPLGPGVLVKLHSLASRADLNGAVGAIEGEIDAARGRYAVRLDGGLAFKLKPSNMSACGVKSTHFVSHACKYDFRRLVHTLREFVDSDASPDDAETSCQFWFNCSTLNQHLAAKGSFTGQWFNFFRDSIESIGHTIAVMMPWRAPINLTRAWCVYEIFETVRRKSNATKCTFLLPPQDRKAMLGTMVLQKGLEELNGVVTDVDVNAAEGGGNERAEILRRARDAAHGGAKALNELVCKALRGWLLDAATTEYTRRDHRLLEAAQHAGREVSFITDFPNVPTAYERLRYTVQHYPFATSIALINFRTKLVCWNRACVRRRPTATSDEQLSDFMATDEAAVMGALERVDADLGADHPDAVKARGELGMCLHFFAHRHDESQAIVSDALLKLCSPPLNLTVLDPWIRRVTTMQNGPMCSAPGQITRRSTLHLGATLGRLMDTYGKFDAAEKLLRSVLRGRTQCFGPDDERTIRSAGSLGYLLSQRNKCPQEALALLQRGGNEHNIAMMMERKGDYAAASELLKVARARASDETSKLKSMMNAGALMYQQGKIREAADQLREVRERSIELNGHKRSALTLIASDNLALVLKKLGNFDEAEALYNETLANFETTKGPDHKDTLLCRGNLAGLWMDQKRFAKAEAQYFLVAKGLEALGEGSPEYLTALDNAATALYYQQNFAECERVKRNVLAGFEKHCGVGHPSTLGCCSYIGPCLERQGKEAEAEAMYRRAFDGAMKHPGMGSSHPKTAFFAMSLAKLLIKSRRAEDAIELLTLAWNARKACLGPGHRETLAAFNKLCEAYSVLGRFDEVRALRAAAQRTLSGSGGAAAPEPAGVDPEWIASFVDMAGCDERTAAFYIQGTVARGLGLDAAVGRYYETECAPPPSDFEWAATRDDAEAEAHLAAPRPQMPAVGQFPTYWIYRCVHPVGVGVRAGPEIPGDCTGDVVKNSEEVVIIERLTKTVDGAELTFLELWVHPDDAVGVERSGGWVFDQTPSGQPCMELVREGEGAKASLGEDEFSFEQAIAAMPAAEAEAMYRRALDGAMKHPEMGPAHPKTAFFAMSLAKLLIKSRRAEQAIELLTLAWNARKECLGTWHTDTSEAVNNMCVAFSVLGRFDDVNALCTARRMGAVAISQATHQIRARAVHSSIALTSDIAMTYLVRAGRAEDAVGLLRPSWEAAVETFGPTHSITIAAIVDLVQAMGHLSQYDDAIAMCQRVLGHARAAGRSCDVTELNRALQWLLQNQARVAAVVGGAAAAPDATAQQVAQLVEMGFSSHDAMAALSSNGFSTERAIAALLG